MKLLTETFVKKISNTLHCFDRIIISGTLPQACYAKGMADFLYSKNIRIFDYAKYVEQFRDLLRENAERVAAENNISIEFVRKASTRKEDLVQKRIKQRGDHPGIVHIISAMETCTTYKPWHDKVSGKTFLKYDLSKCLYYYFYFMDEVLGLGYIRVATWCPFPIRIYINGHNILANQLKQAGIGYRMLDNAFDHVDDPVKAQELSNALDVNLLHKKLDEYARKCCPVQKIFDQRYHYSISQAEYATDIVFDRQSDLQNIYGELITTAIHTVKPDNIATFLGHKLNPLYQGEMGNNYNIRIEGSRIKHQMGKSSIKMYDKFSKILRIETTTNEVSEFKHYREVEHRDGTKSKQIAPLKKNIYSLPLLQEVMQASNKRYLEFISAFENKETGRKRLQKVTETKKIENRSYPGFSFFKATDLNLLQCIARGEFNINGMRNKDIQGNIHQNSNKVSRFLKRLLVHGLIKKVQKTYKYYLTKLGKHAIIMAEKIKELELIPAFIY